MSKTVYMRGLQVGVLSVDGLYGYQRLCASTQRTLLKQLGSISSIASQVFISDIRGCQNKEQEQRRVDKELAKIRAKFGEDKQLSGGQRPNAQS